MIISEADATWAADKFIDYFKNFTNLEEYLRAVKKAVITSSSQLHDPKEDFFNVDIHPEEMEFDIRLVGNRFPNGIQQEYYKNLLRSVFIPNFSLDISRRKGL